MNAPLDLHDAFTLDRRFTMEGGPNCLNGIQAQAPAQHGHMVKLTGLPDEISGFEEVKLASATGYLNALQGIARALGIITDLAPPARIGRRGPLT